MKTSRKRQLLAALSLFYFAIAGSSVRAGSDDPFVIAELLARPSLAERLPMNWHAHDQRIHSELELLARIDARLPTFSVARNVIYTVPTILDRANGCTDDTWTATTVLNAPSARIDHTAVWTGSEMIIWGGDDGSNYFNTGGRYNPGTDSWLPTSTTNAPAGRAGFVAIWTGTEMIVWGGFNDTFLNSGSKYNPGTNSWTAISTTNAPSPRDSATTVWTGNEMIVWGGWSGSIPLNTGRKYNPATNSWTATATTNAPTARFLHTAVWTGHEMIVWGGWDNDSNYFNTGGRYDPSTNSWTALSTNNVPAGRSGHTAVWTGNEMIVWGGADSSVFLDTGGRYDPSTNSWTSASTTNSPSARANHAAVWTGSEMIVWAGIDQSFNDTNTGGRYSPSTDNWTATTITNAPSGRESHVAVWASTEMIVWGGYAGLPDVFKTGGKYCAQSPAPMVESAVSRKSHGAAGTFDVSLSLTDNVGIECRSGGASNSYQVVATFLNAVTFTSSSVTSGNGMVSGAIGSGTTVVTIDLTGVTNAQTINVTLFGVDDGAGPHDITIPMAILVGDTTGNGSVSSSDVSQVKLQSGQPITNSNFRADVNVSGTINSTDVSSVKLRTGTSLPAIESQTGNSASGKR